MQDYKIKIEPIKNTRGRIDRYKAIFGTFEEIGATKEEAKNNLIKALDWFFDDSAYPMRIRHSKLKTFIMTRDFNGYSIQVSAKDGSYDAGSYGFGRRSDSEAERELNFYTVSCTECNAEDSFIDTPYIKLIASYDIKHSEKCQLIKEGDLYRLIWRDHTNHTEPLNTTYSRLDLAVSRYNDFAPTTTYKLNQDGSLMNPASYAKAIIEA